MTAAYTVLTSANVVGAVKNLSDAAGGHSELDDDDLDKVFGDTAVGRLRSALFANALRSGDCRVAKNLLDDR